MTFTNNNIDVNNHNNGFSEKWLNLLADCGIFEIRIPGKPKIASGYFDKLHIHDALEAIQQYNGKANVYATLNPVSPELHSRYYNRIERAANSTTGDKDILKRENIPIDVDSIRPAGISASDTEHEAALELIKVIRNTLIENYGFPASSMILADSGNGGHIVLKVELPNDKETTELVSKFLKALAFLFDNDKVCVDQTTFNAARIFKLYGTMAVKGDNTPERPHRISKIISIPDNIQPATLEQIQSIISKLPSDPKVQAKNYSGQDNRIDLPAFIARHGLEVTKEKDTAQGGHMYILRVCPFNPEHTGTVATLTEYPSGAVQFACKHNSCAGKVWRDVYGLLEPELYRTNVTHNVNSTNPYKGIYTNAIDFPTNERNKNATGNATGERYTDSKTQQPLSKRIEEYVKTTTAWFETPEMDRDLGITTPADKNNRREKMLRLCESGIIEAHPRINKQFRYVNTKVTSLNFKTATTTGILPVYWPLGIESKVNLFPGNVVVVAGEPNAGKTALMLHFIQLNQDTFPIYYWCSEMGEVELRDRLDKFPGMDINDWKFEAKERARDFPDVIVPDAINLIDFLEMTDNLYEVNTVLTAISHKIGSGLAVVCIQKKEGAKYGRGQEFGLEKPKLYLSLSKHKMQIVKGKSWAVKNADPNGMFITFRVLDGCRFENTTEWCNEENNGY